MRLRWDEVAGAWQRDRAQHHVVCFRDSGQLGSLRGQKLVRRSPLSEKQVPTAFRNVIAVEIISLCAEIQGPCPIYLTDAPSMPKKRQGTGFK
jgi:hypothetical protein